MDKANLIGAPSVGQFWPEQGGIYAGRLEIYGELHGIVFAPEDLEDKINWLDAMEAANLHDANGFADWELPKLKELLAAGENDAVRQHFAQTWYWSSSQHSTTTAWLLHFIRRSQCYATKSGSFRVRPVRRFKIENLNDSCGGLAGQLECQPIETASPSLSDAVANALQEIASKQEKFEGVFGRSQWAGYAKKLIERNDVLRGLMRTTGLTGADATTRISLAKVKSAADMRALIDKLRHGCGETEKAAEQLEVVK